MSLMGWLVGSNKGFRCFMAFALFIPFTLLFIVAVLNALSERYIIAVPAGLFAVYLGIQAVRKLEWVTKKSDLTLFRMAWGREWGGR